ELWITFAQTLCQRAKHPGVVLVAPLRRLIADLDGFDVSAGPRRPERPGKVAAITASFRFDVIPSVASDELKLQAGVDIPPVPRPLAIDRRPVRPVLAERK